MRKTVFTPNIPALLHKTSGEMLFLPYRNIHATSRPILNTINGLKYYCAKFSQDFMIAKQFGLNLNIGVINNCKEVDMVSKITQTQLNEFFIQDDPNIITDHIKEDEHNEFIKNIDREDFTVFINPIVLPVDQGFSRIEEQSVSHFYINAFCERYNKISVNYKDEKMRRHEKEFSNENAFKIQQLYDYQNYTTSLHLSRSKGRFILSDTFKQEMTEVSSMLNELTEEIQTALPNHEINDLIHEEGNIHFSFLDKDYEEDFENILECLINEYKDKFQSITKKKTNS